MTRDFDRLDAIAKQRMQPESRPPHGFAVTVCLLASLAFWAYLGITAFVYEPDAVVHPDCETEAC